MSKSVNGVVKCGVLAIFIIFAASASGYAKTIVLDGLIEPSMIVNIGSPVPGILQTVKVDRGKMVKKGQVVARLKSDVERVTMELARTRAEMESGIRVAEARLKFSLRKQERFEELYKKEVIPFKEMDEARTESELALMELEESKDNRLLAEMEFKRSREILRRMSIRSTISGVVMERFLAPGEHVEDQPILKVAQIDPLYVEIFAPLELLGGVKVGMTADLAPEEPVGRVYKARVTIVDRVVDAASGTFGLRLELPNPQYNLPAGLKCKVTFRLK